MVYIGTAVTCVLVVLFLYQFGRVRLQSEYQTSFFTFVAILFTTGLDAGLIMLPLTEFAQIADPSLNPELQFAHPLAIEFGFWAGGVWAIYFVTCIYFCLLEPKVKFFEKPAVKLINTACTLLICAFTVALLLKNLHWYFPLWNRSQPIHEFVLLVASVVCIATFTSLKTKFIRWLSVGSMLIFSLLVVLMWQNTGQPIQMLMQTGSNISAYVFNFHEFVFPINEHHEFYWFWWFSWSLVIGQFMAKFVNGLTVYQVFLALVFVPVIPVGVWFSVLYFYFENSVNAHEYFAVAMVCVALLFVINSADSLIRLYCLQLNISDKSVGKLGYFVINGGLLFIGILIFHYQFISIFWIGNTVITLFLLALAFFMGRSVKTKLASQAVTCNAVERIKA